MSNPEDLGILFNVPSAEELAEHGLEFKLSPPDTLTCDELEEEMKKYDNAPVGMPRAIIISHFINDKVEHTAPCTELSRQFKEELTDREFESLIKTFSRMH